MADWVMLSLPLAGFVGPHPMQEQTPEHASFAYRIGFLAILVWWGAIACTKISVGLTLLRFLKTRPWRVFLWSLISIQVALTVTNILYLTLRCRPIQQAWSLTPDSHACWDPKPFIKLSYASAGIHIAIDIALSLIPVAFLLNLRRPRAERVLLILLMTTGLFTSAVALRRTILLDHFGSPDEDPMALNVVFPTWTCTEELLGVAATCTPSLKPQLQKLLSRFGVSFESVHLSSLPTIHSVSTMSNKKPLMGIKLSTRGFQWSQEGSANTGMLSDRRASLGQIAQAVSHEVSKEDVGVPLGAKEIS